MTKVPNKLISKEEALKIDLSKYLGSGIPDNVTWEERVEYLQTLGWKVKEDPLIILQDIRKAFETSENRAGIVTKSDIEETRTEKEIMTDMTFKDKDNCDCKCHPNKNECMECYQHPTHLKKNHKKIE